MIPVGTLCMIVGAVLFPEHNGRTCTTISGLLSRPAWPDELGYDVCYADGTSEGWVACCLFPLAPPAPDSQTTRDKALEMA